MRSNYMDLVFNQSYKDVSGNHEEFDLLFQILYLLFWIVFFLVITQGEMDEMFDLRFEMPVPLF